MRCGVRARRRRRADAGAGDLRRLRVRNQSRRRQQKSFDLAAAGRARARRLRAVLMRNARCFDTPTTRGSSPRRAGDASTVVTGRSTLGQLARRAMLALAAALAPARAGSAATALSLRRSADCPRPQYTRRRAEWAHRSRRGWRRGRSSRRRRRSIGRGLGKPDRNVASAAGGLHDVPARAKGRSATVITSSDEARRASVDFRHETRLVGDAHAVAARPIPGARCAPSGWCSVSAPASCRIAGARHYLPSWPGLRSCGERRPGGAIDARSMNDFGRFTRRRPGRSIRLAAAADR